MGDFVLQPDGIAEQKAKNTKWMLCHGLLVSTLTYILLGDPKAWWIAGIILFLHLLVDYIKVWISNRTQKCLDFANRTIRESCSNDKDSEENRQTKPERNLLLFIGDQALHILFIVALWLWLSLSGSAAFLTNHWAIIWGLNYAKGLLLLIGLATGVWGIAIVLKYQMEEFAVELTDTVKQGLPKGGKTIGVLERLLVFMFVIAGKPEGVGFVLAAKTVFRIGQLTNRQEKDHAEYIMIGTLRSFTYALFVAFAIKWLIGHIRL